MDASAGKAIVTGLPPSGKTSRLIELFLDSLKERPDERRVMIVPDSSHRDYLRTVIIERGECRALRETEVVTLAEFLRLLAELRQALPAAGLDPDTAEVIEADVQVVEEQAQKEKPSTAVIVAKLKSIAEVLTASGAVATAAQKLLPVAQQALTWAQQLFH